MPPEEAERRCRRALVEAWTGRESLSFRLPPSRLALDPTDTIAQYTDSKGNTQPIVTPWNPLGYYWNGIHRVGFSVEA